MRRASVLETAEETRREIVRLQRIVRHAPRQVRQERIELAPPGPPVATSRPQLSGTVLLYEWACVQVKTTLEREPRVPRCDFDD